MRRNTTNGTNGSESWRSVRVGPENTGANSAATAPEELSNTIWKTDIDTHGNGTAVANGTVYIGSTDGHIYALDAQTGEEQWRYATDGEIWRTPAVYNGIVYTTSEDNDVHAIAADTGESEWVYNTDESGWSVGAPIVSEGTVFAPMTKFGLLALNSTTGEKQWEHEQASGQGSPAVSDGSVYMSSGTNDTIPDPIFVSLSVTNGNENWRTKIDDYADIPAVRGGSVYIGTDSGTVYALSKESGSIEWQFNTGDEIHAGPSVANNTVIVGNNSSMIYAIDAETGSKKWEFSAGGLVASEPAIVEGTVYIGANNNTLYAIDLESGEQLSKHSVRTGTVTGHPAVVNQFVFLQGHAISDVAAPTAEFSYSPSAPEVDEEITFDASNSHASNGSIERFQWDLDDDGTYEKTGETINHTYSDTGSHDVTLQVVDDNKSTDTVTKTIEVIENDPPNAAFSYSPTSPEVGEEITFNASDSEDPDGSINIFQWDLDADGTYEQDGTTTTHQYSTAGTYSISLQVVDDQGAVDTRTREISIHEKTTQTPTETTTQTTTTAETTLTTTSNSTTATNSRVTSTVTHDYDLRAGQESEVRLSNQTYYVIDNIPGVESDRKAVTNRKYNLVPPSTAVDALTAEHYIDTPWVVDWSKQIEQARSHREEAKDLQIFGRAVDAGWDITVIIDSFLVGQPQLALGSAINLMTDTINWGYTEYEDPFQEGFTKMTASLTNTKTIQVKAAEMQSNARLGQQINNLMGALTLAGDAVGTGKGLAAAWGEAARAMQQSSAPTGSADDALRSADDLAAQSVDDAVKASSSLFIGFALSLSVGQMNSAVKAKTKIHTAELALETVRIPLLQRLAELQQKANNGSLTRSEAIELDVGRATNYQMLSIMFQIGSNYWRAISNQGLGTVWDIIAGAEQKAENYRQRANSLENTSKWNYISAGAVYTGLTEQLQNSINHEAFSDGENR